MRSRSRELSRMSTPIGSSCWIVARSVIAATAGLIGPNQIADLDAGLADPSVERGVHPAIAQIQLGIANGSLGGGRPAHWAEAIPTA